MADAALNWATGAQQLDPNGMSKPEADFVHDEAEIAQAYDGNGILTGFKMPSDMTAGDLAQMVSTMESYATEVGWRYMPRPNEVINAWRAGAHDYQSAAKIWGAKLPASLGWVKHGKTAAQFSQYKEDNKQAILTRYGAHGDSKDENFVHNLDNPLTSFGAQGSSIGQQPQPADNLQKSAIR